MKRRASRLNVLESFELASPCDMEWAAMIGNDQKRFCGACNKNVYNLIDMEVEDIADLILATEGKFCGRVYQRADGTLMTQDCPVGLARVLQEAKRRSRRMIVAAVTFACAGASFALFGNTTDPRVFGRDAAGTKVIEKVETVMSVPEPPQPPPDIALGAMMPQPPDRPRETRLGALGPRRVQGRLLPNSAQRSRGAPMARH